MNTVYTTTITRAARRRGIRVKVIEPDTPIFELGHRGRWIRCYNALTDRVGAVSFHLAQDKYLANVFLKKMGFPVPAQERFTTWAAAVRCLRRHRCLVVKPRLQWGGRGVAMGVRTPEELREAVKRARRFEEDVLLEECLEGVDQRLIYINFRFVCAIRRAPASVTGNGRSTLRQLILAKNAVATKLDPSHRIPLDEETLRTLRSEGLDYAHIPEAGITVRVRRNANYHTGGAVEISTSAIPRRLSQLGARIARAVGIPVLGIDFLVDEKSGQARVLELSPDLAISPPEGEVVVEYFLDDLFPGSRKKNHKKARDLAGAGFLRSRRVKRP